MQMFYAQVRHLVAVLRHHHPAVAEMAEQALLGDPGMWSRAPPEVQQEVLQGLQEWAAAMGSEGIPGR